MNRHKVLVYGTLRPGFGATRLVPGVMYDLGSFPGVLLADESEGKFITVEEIEVDDAGLRRLDSYEGYRESAPQSSLYLRVKAPCGAWIYEYNDTPGPERIVESGDWLEHTGKPRGRAAGLAGDSYGG